MANGKSLLIRVQILFAVYCIGGCSSINNNSSPVHDYISLDSCVLREGDIVFRQGMGIESHFINKLDSATLFSHVGIIVDTLDTIFIVHTLPHENNDHSPQKIRRQPIHDFLRIDRAKACAIGRVDDPIAVSEAVKYAKLCLSRNVPFDYALNAEDSTSMYCSELVWRAYMKGGIDISDGHRHRIPALANDIIFPSDILFSSRVKVVYQCLSVNRGK